MRQHNSGSPLVFGVSVHYVRRQIEHLRKKLTSQIGRMWGRIFCVAVWRRTLSTQETLWQYFLGLEDGPRQPFWNIYGLTKPVTRQ